jgi:hypothetical protein
MTSFFADCPINLLQLAREAIGPAGLETSLCRRESARFFSEHRKIVIGQGTRDITLTDHHRLQVELGASDADVNTLVTRRIGHEWDGRSERLALRGVCVRA